MAGGGCLPRGDAPRPCRRASCCSPSRGMAACATRMRLRRGCWGGRSSTSTRSSRRRCGRRCAGCRRRRSQRADVRGAWALDRGGGDRDRRPRSALLVARDVTAARQTEQLRRNFVANASHELKTPVASILGLPSALERAAGDAEATRRFVGMLGREAERLSRAGVRPARPVAARERCRPAGAGAPDQTLLEHCDKLRPDAERRRHAAVRRRAQAAAGDGPRARPRRWCTTCWRTPSATRRPAARCGSRSAGSMQQPLSRSRHRHRHPRADLDRVFERFYRVDAAATARPAAPAWAWRSSATWPRRTAATVRVNSARRCGLDVHGAAAACCRPGRRRDAAADRHIVRPTAVPFTLGSPCSRILAADFRQLRAARARREGLVLGHDSDRSHRVRTRRSSRRG